MSYKHVGAVDFSLAGYMGSPFDRNVLNIAFKMELSLMDESATTDQLVTYFRKTLTSHLDLFQTVRRQPPTTVFGVF